MMDKVLITFAFLAGIQGFFAPCSIALIPAYMGYYINDSLVAGRGGNIQHSLKAGSLASFGLISIYIPFGVAMSLLGKILAPFVPWIELLTGSVLIFLGIAVLLNYEFAVRPPVVFQAKSKGFLKYYLFGIAYALGSIGCTLPIFLLVIFQALSAGGVITAVANFAVYSLAMVLLMIVFSLVASFSKTAITQFMVRYLPLIQKTSSLLILSGGIYLVYLSIRVLTI